MLSEQTWKYYTNYLDYATKLILFPFGWNPVNGKLEHVIPKHRLYLYYFALIWCTLDSIYVGYVAVIVCTPEDSTFPLDQRVKIVVHFVTRFLCVFLHYLMIISGRKTVEFFNHLFEMNTIFQRKFERIQADDRIRRNVIFGVCVGYFQPLGPCLNYILDYRMIHYWPSRVIPEIIYSSFFGRIPFLLIEFYISAMSIQVTILYGLQTALFGRISSGWLSLIRDKIVEINPINYNQNCMGTKRGTQNLLCSYRTLQLITSSFNRAHKNGYWPFGMTLLLGGHVFTNVAAISIIRVSHSPPPIAFLFLAGALMLFYSEHIYWDSASGMRQLSCEFKDELSKLGTKETQLFSKSCQPLQLEVGMFFAIKTSTAFSYCQALIDYTVTVLLSFDIT